MPAKKISIIIPVYNEQDNVAELHRRIDGAVKSEQYEFDIIFIDDGSSDATLERIAELNRQDPRVKALSFSRNFGHQSAILAGIDAAEGDAVIMMDGDLQHPPEMLPRMIRKWEEGYEIVTTLREKTSGAGPLKNLTASLFYLIINRIGNVNVEKNAADFRLLDRKAAGTLRSIRERARFTRGLISWIGFKKTAVPYTAEKRHAGETKYTFVKMFKFALDAVVSFSAFPLRLSTFLGLFATLLGILYFIYILYAKVSGRTVQGWTSLMAVIIFFGGVQMIVLGVIGEYISRIYEETKQRPPYIVSRSIGDIDTPE